MVKRVDVPVRVNAMDVNGWLRDEQAEAVLPENRTGEDVFTSSPIAEDFKSVGIDPCSASKQLPPSQNRKADGTNLVSYAMVSFFFELLPGRKLTLIFFPAGFDL